MSGWQTAMQSRQMSTEHDNWRARAACRNHDPELFFSISAAGIQAAKAICVTCPVTARCHDAAEALGADDGVWGGMDELERRAPRRTKPRRRPAPSGPGIYLTPEQRAPILRELRDQGLSNAKIAEWLGVHPRTVIRWCSELREETPA